METSPFPDLEGYFEPLEALEGHLSEPQLVPKAIAEQQLRKTYWRVSFQRVQFGNFQGHPACLLVVETKFAPEDRRRHRFTKAQISMEFIGEQRDDVEVQAFAPEWAKGITVPEEHTSGWAIRPRVAASLAPIPGDIDIVVGEYGHRKMYQIDRCATMQGSKKGLPRFRKVHWSLNEANQEGIPWRIPYLVVLMTYAAGKPFKIKFAINASIGPSLNPQRWQIFAKSLEPVSLDEGMKLIPTGGEVDRDFTSLDLGSLTKTSFE